MTYKDVLAIFKAVSPTDAYKDGMKECGGRFFDPSKANRARMVLRINALLKRTKDPAERGHLLGLKVPLEHPEPQQLLEGATWTLFAYLVKDGSKGHNLIPLIKSMTHAVEVQDKEYKVKDPPIEVRIFINNSGKGMIGILEAMKEGGSPKLRTEIVKLQDAAIHFIERFPVEGLDKGGFDEIFPILKKHAKGVGRQGYYPDYLRYQYGFFEIPQEIERMATGWLDNELTVLKGLVGTLSKRFGCAATQGDVQAEVSKRRGIAPKALMSTIQVVRGKLQPVMEESLVGITPAYKVNIIPTPRYLKAFIPSAAMTNMDGLTSKPFNYFFVTTDGDMEMNIPELVQMIIHEEYGHCVNFSNTSKAYGAKVPKVNRIVTNLCLPISEAISFGRETEFIDIFAEAVSGRRKPTRKEKAFLDHMSKLYKGEEWFTEMEFVVCRWRLFRFLRAMGDIRINTGRETIPQFVSWASQRTGLSEKEVFSQIFIFQAQPGYAPCYSIGRNWLFRYQAKALKAGISRKEFNTFASAMGFPTREVGGKILDEFIKTRGKQKK